MEATLNACFFFKWAVQAPPKELFSCAGSMKSFPEMKDFVINPVGYILGYHRMSITVSACFVHGSLDSLGNSLNLWTVYFLQEANTTTMMISFV